MDSTRLVNPIGGGKRLDYNDLAKAFGMLAIIWGHIRLTGWSNAFVYAWHIPLFFFLSGMVFNKCKYADFRTFFYEESEIAACAICDIFVLDLVCMGRILLSDTCPSG